MLDAVSMRHTCEQKWAGFGQCGAPGPLLEPPLLDLARALSGLHAVPLQAEGTVTAGCLLCTHTGACTLDKAQACSGTVQGKTNMSSSSTGKAPHLQKHT